MALKNRLLGRWQPTIVAHVVIYSDMPTALIYTVYIDGTDISFSAAADAPLLRSAELAAPPGLHVSSSCRNGTCRACLRKLITGKVMYRIDWPGLSADEKRDGYVLPCVAYPVSDLVIEPVASGALLPPDSI